MAIPTLPDQSDANAASFAAQTAAVTAGNAAFIQSATILIENAISNSLYAVEPFLPINVDYNVVAAYFTGLGYTVQLLPIGPFGWPPIYPAPGWNGFPGFFNGAAPPPAFPSLEWESWQLYVQSHVVRTYISWGPPPTS